jgi:hypothetical protein
MTRTRLALALAASLSLSAQVPDQRWSFGVHQFGPTLEGHFSGKQDGNPLVLDLKQDFALGKDKTTPGAFIEYMGPRFGLYLSMDAQDYAGSGHTTQKVSINGTDFSAGADLRSKLKLQASDFAWTIRVFKFEQAWIGVDLGAQIWNVDMEATGIAAPPVSQVRTGAQKVTAPIPQLGLSAGGHFLGSRGVVKAFYHFLSIKGATYTRLNVDVRYFFLDWLGARVTTDTQSFKAPQNSLDKDLEAQLDRNGIGFGLVARW